MRGCGILKLRSRLFWLFVTTWMAVISAPAKAVPGDIYVSRCCGTEEIDRVTPDGSRTVFAATGLQSPMDLAFDRSGNLFVANYGSNSIEEFTPAGVGTVFASTGQYGPSNLAFDAAGNLFVSISGNNTILKFNPSGVGSVFASTGLSNPQGLAFDRFGSLFVANNGDNTIRRFTPAGAGSVFASSVFSGSIFNLPSVLAFDSGGNLFAGNFVTTIVRFTPSGTKSAFATVPSEVEGLAFDGAGNLLVANGGGASLLSIAADGTQRTVTGGLFVATGLAIEPVVPSSVPEPTGVLTFAMAVAAFTLAQRRWYPGQLRIREKWGAGGKPPPRDREEPRRNFVNQTHGRYRRPAGVRDRLPSPRYAA